jgi:hypothetical protein
MTDTFYRLLASSDPLITSLEKLKIKDSKPLPSEVMDLLLPVVNSNLTATESETESCSDDDFDFDV